MDPIKISDIKNAALKALATISDNDKSGFIEEDESGIFSNYFNVVADTADEDAKTEFKRIMGLSQESNDETSSAASATSTEKGLASMSEQDLKDVKLVNGINLYDVLSVEYLKKDYLEEDKLKQHLEEIGKINSGMTETDVNRIVIDELSRRQKRFNPDGTYNLDELKDVVSSTVGIDKMLNQSKDKQSSELYHTTNELNMLLFGSIGIDDYLKTVKGYRTSRALRKQDRVVKKVVEFVGDKVQKNEHKIAEFAKDVAKYGVPQVIAAAVAPYTVPENYNLIHTINNNYNYNNVYLNGELIEKDVNQYTTNGVDLLLDSRCANLVRNLAVSAGIALATAVLQDLVIGQERPFEKTAFNLDAVKPKFDSNGDELPNEYNNLEAFNGYVDRLAKKSSFPANTIKVLAGNFTYEVCGKKYFDFEDFKNCYEELAGKGSNMNYEELLNIGSEQGVKIINKYKQLMNIKKQEKEECCGGNQQPAETTAQENEDKVTDTVAETTPESATPTEEVQPPVIKIAQRTTETVDARKSGWTRLTQCYTCWDGVPNLSNRIRILKLAQGVTDGDYSKERMDKLLELNREYGSGEKFKQACKDAGIEFNFDAFNAALKGTALGDVVLPKNFYGCERTNDTNLAIKVTKKANGTKYNATKTTQYRVNENGTKRNINKEAYDEYKKAGAEDEDW